MTGARITFGDDAEQLAMGVLLTAQGVAADVEVLAGLVSKVTRNARGALLWRLRGAAINDDEDDSG